MTVRAIALMVILLFSILAIAFLITVRESSLVLSLSLFLTVFDHVQHATMPLNLVDIGSKCIPLILQLRF